MGRAVCAALAACLLALAAPAFASAATRYVDFETGDDQGAVNTCLVQASPCQTIDRALVASASNADTILVDDDTYPEAALLVEGNKELTASNFVVGDSGPTIIDPGSDPDPVIITGLGFAPTVSGFTIRNDSDRLVEVRGPATIAGNTFDETNVAFPVMPQLLITAVAGDPTVSGNEFVRPFAGGTAIRSMSADSPLISGNHITRYNGSIDLGAGTPRVVGNEIVGQTGAGSCEPCAGIFIDSANATITGNFLHDPEATIGTAIALTEFGGAPATEATLSRNLVVGGYNGLSVDDFGGTVGPVSSSGDAFVGYSHAGIEATAGAVDVTNATVASAVPGITADILITQTASIDLDSSIVSSGGLSATPITACSISFSRGPVLVPGGDPCDDFQTTAPPMLAGPADFHLLPGSPMIDAGNPAAPAVGTLDLDGDARALLAGCAGTTPGRRDIGADEFAGTPPGCNPPTPAGPKKCKRKGKKKAKKGALAAKKKCKKKRKRKRKK